MTNPTQEVLLTEDGHPIGEVVIADRTAVAAMPNERSVEENREDLMKSEAVALTKEPDADKAVAELYPEYGNDELRKRAMIAYIADGRSPDEIAEALGITGRTVSMWAYNGRWDELLRKEIRARHAQSVLELARVRSERRVSVVRAQLAQAEEIRGAAMTKIYKDGITMSAQAAWTAAAKVEQTLVGMSEAGAVTGSDAKEESEKKADEGKRPLVMVFQNGGLPPMRGGN